MKELIKAIANAKKEIGKVSKESTNPFFKSKYFDVNQLLEHVEPVLQKHGLIILQPIQQNRVCSDIYHIESGEVISSSIELPTITDPQKLGSAITYYRRYTLQSLLSLQAEDDDANKASGKTKQATKPNCPDTQIEGAIKAIANGDITKGEALKKLFHKFDLTIEQQSKLK